MNTALAPREKSKIDNGVADLARIINSATLSYKQNDETDRKATGAWSQATDAGVKHAIEQLLFKYDTSLRELGLLESVPSPSLVDELLG